MPYTVTRQCQWPEGAAVVEISVGGIDYTNPDALVATYPGEFETYDAPHEAVEAAIAICRAWRKDSAPKARVAIGATLGMTMPFEPCSFAAARLWAAKMLEAMPKCDRCGDILPDPYYTHPDLDDQRFCREYCAEQAAIGLEET
jgi:hypothetical protein